MKKNTGFGVVGIVLVVVTVALVGLIGWRLYDANKNKQSNSTSSNNQTQQNNSASQSNQSDQATQTDPNEGYVVIKEWGVRFKPIEGLNDVEYSIGNIKGSNGTASFSTSELSKYGDSCSASQTGMAPLGKLIRTQGVKEDATPVSTSYAAQIGDYYYQYVTPQTVCSDDSTATALQSQTLALFKVVVKSLEAAK